MNDKTHVDSAGDNRTVNNTVRHAYRVLNDEEKAMMQQIKDAGEQFADLLHYAGKTGPYAVPNNTTYDPERFGSANLTLAFRHIEDAVMRAVKHITK